MAKFNALRDYEDALEVLNDLVTFVEDEDLDEDFEEEWPTLFEIYLKARQIVRDSDE